MDKLKAFLATTAGRVVVTVLAAGLVYGLMFLAAGIGSSLLAMIVFAVCAYFGWKVLDFITPNIFLIMPIGGWLIYWVIKGVLAFFVGFIVAPFQIGAMISKEVCAKGERG